MSVDMPQAITGVDVHVRQFREDDYARLVEITNQCYVDMTWTVEELRHQDSIWDRGRYTKLRLMAELEGRTVGTGRINHVPDEFHPRKFWLEIAVDPSARHRGVGSTLYQRLLAELRARDAIAVRAGVHRETDAAEIRFLTQRGFVEAQRGWQWRLHVPSFDFGAFGSAEERIARQGIALTTLAAEREHDPNALRKAHALVSACEQDVPSVDRVTEIPFDLFIAHTIDSPNAAPDAFFIAKDGSRYAGVSNLYRPMAEPGIIYQGLTGVLREYRGRGIAMALKLQTVRFAREHGYVEIRTWNDVRNQPMLRINNAMGFARQPAWINFEKHLLP